MPMFQRKLTVDFIISNILKWLDERRKQGQIRKHTSAPQTAMRMAHWGLGLLSTVPCTKSWVWSQNSTNWTWSQMTVNLAPWRWRQEERKFKVCYTDPTLKNKKWNVGLIPVILTLGYAEAGGLLLSLRSTWAFLFNGMAGGTSACYGSIIPETTAM